MTKPTSHHIYYHTTPYGLRIVHCHIPAAPVAFCGVIVRAGSRDELPHQYGLAHFVEHTIFKGTASRSASNIINRMEAVGGELNAYTTKEETVIYSVFPHGNLARAAGLIADLVGNSQFPERELCKEREVVADEIDSYLDSPADAVYDDFEDLIFADTPLGHNILGTESHLAAFTSDACRDYLRQYYAADNMVAFYSGADTPARVFALIEREMAALPPAAAPRPYAAPIALPPQGAMFPAQRCHKPIVTHQAHTVVGAVMPGLHSPDRYAISLLANILGGPGMNSLLNVAMRERRGLVYTVEASASLLSDCCLFTIYYGCDPDDNRRCLSLVASTIARLADAPMTPRRLAAAKRQFLGQLVISNENRENTLLSAARATLISGRVTPMADAIAAINDITAADIARIAALLAEAPALTLGPKK